MIIYYNKLQTNVCGNNDKRDVDLSVQITDLQKDRQCRTVCLTEISIRSTQDVVLKLR